MKLFTLVNRISTLCYILFVMSIYGYGQTVIQGVVMDRESNETILGARIAIKDQGIGTTTNLDGVFQLSTNVAPPFVLEISSIGYKKQEVEVSQPAMALSILLVPESSIEQRVVVSASRVEERILEAPVSVEKMGLLDIQYDPMPDFYTAVAHLKGVIVRPTSLTYNSINTRGFAFTNNWRFVQLVDGVDVTGVINNGIGNLMRGSELDVRNIEIVPGPGSALYGPNVFNGLSSISTKSPFDYQGLSAYIKQGFTNQENVDANPFWDVGFRFAKVLGNKFAFKTNITYFKGTEWDNDDESYSIIGQSILERERLLQLPRNHPQFDAVNVWGDETAVPIDLGNGEILEVNRTGFTERELFDYDVENIGIQASLHYKITDKTELVYDFRYVTGDNISRHSISIPVKNFISRTHRLELSGERFFLRTYLFKDKPNDSFNALSGGILIQEGLKPSVQWGMDYGAAFRGEIPGIQPGIHDLARIYADRDIPGPDTDIFQQVKDNVVSTGILQGGAAATTEADFFHVDAGYDFTNLIPGIGLQTGGSYRRYQLESNGNFYNDGPNGFGEPIPVEEYGVYIQGDKRLFEEHLNLRGSIRYDKNQNFKGRFTPRLSSVLTLGEDRQHNFRISWQTGFRNPANQDIYSFYNLTGAIYVGNVEDNISAYRETLPNGQVVTGQEIYDQLLTSESAFAFLATGGRDFSILETADLEFLRQERITTFEVGYRGLLSRNLLVDLNYYRNTFEDLTTNIVTISPTLGFNPVIVLGNVSGAVYSSGLGTGIEYITDKGFRLGANYTFTEFDASEALESNPNFLPDFNMPRHMVKLSLANRKLTDRLGFSIHYSWLDNFTYRTPVGEGKISEYDVLDAAIFCRIPEIKTILKVGGANILNETYRAIYGGPTVGSQIYLQLTFDDLIK